MLAGPPPSVRGAFGLEAPLAGSVVTLGTFDGVHSGHRELVGRAVERARAQGVPAVVYTFDPHPAKLLAPHAAPKTITSTRERVRLLRALGVDLVVVEPFDAPFAELSADAWVERYLFARLRPRHVVVGFNFGYGKGRKGGPEHLRRAGEDLGFTVEVVDAVGHAKSAVSSTRIRERIAAGDVAGASEMLGHPYALTGEVVRGDGRGRTIQIPTANLAPEAELVPATGVYAARVVVDPPDDLPEDAAADAERGSAIGRGTAHLAVTNVGVRPTFDGSKLSIESHLLDFSGDLYGLRLRVELTARIREERRFAGVDALVLQIRADIEAARRLGAGVHAEPRGEGA